MSSLSRPAREVALHRRPALFRLSGLALSLSLVFGWAGHAQAQETPLSLSDALKTAAFEHPSVAARIKERAGAEARLDVANRQKLPALVGQSGVDGLGNRTATVRIEQSLWTGGRIDGEVSSAQAGIRRADHVVAAAQNDIMIKVLNAFTELARVQARQLAARSNVDEHLRLAQMIERRVDSNISPASDGVLASARFSQAKAELNQLEALAIRSRSTLGQALGRPVSAIALPEQRNMGQYSLEALVKAALDYAPALQQLAAELDAARADVEVKKSVALPQVKLRVDRTVGGAFPNTQAYIALEYQTGAGLSAYAAVREAEARVDAVALQAEAARRDLIDSVSADWADYRSFAVQVRDLEKQVESTTSVFDSFVRQYAVGRKGWTDVLNAQREVAQARYQLADAVWGQFRAAVRLQIATGMVSPDNMLLVQSREQTRSLVLADPVPPAPAADAVAVTSPAPAGEVTAAPVPAPATPAPARTGW